MLRKLRKQTLDLIQKKAVVLCQTMWNLSLCVSVSQMVFECVHGHKSDSDASVGFI